MILSRLCGFFDEVLVLEKIRQRTDVSALFRNMLEYAYKSHLVLCAVVIERIPENTKMKNVSARILQKGNQNLSCFNYVRNGQTFCQRFLKST